MQAVTSWRHPYSQAGAGRELQRAGDAWYQTSRHTHADARRGPRRMIAKQTLMGDEGEPAPFVSIGKRVLADDHQCGRNIATESSAQLMTARGGPFQIDVEKKFEMASLRAEACDFSSRLCGNAKRLRRSLVLDDMQPGATLFFHLFCRDYSAAKVGELRKLALDRLQAFMPSSVSDLGHCTIPDCPPKLVI